MSEGGSLIICTKEGGRVDPRPFLGVFEAGSSYFEGREELGLRVMEWAK
ncbi:hypothetical protein HMPREF1556_00795 [Porphyromonas sp. oral taxon 278 str. W7784]|nr:hypothetical protein HMPREF1556_00795 [Porphyromonas sp. oral taxon 278 str. W7784]